MESLSPVAVTPVRTFFSLEERKKQERMRDGEKKEQLGVRYGVVRDPEDRQTDSRSQTGESRAGGRCEMWERDTKSRGAVRRKEG